MGAFGLGILLTVYLGRFVLVAILGILIIVSVREFRYLFLLRPRIHRPGSFSPEQWTALVRSFSARKQAHLIACTDHQSLRVTPQQFLEILDSVAPAIKKDPAASVYWQHRHELQQVLKQERLG
jgi:hypothetical protein